MSCGKALGPIWLALIALAWSGTFYFGFKAWRKSHQAGVARREPEHKWLDFLDAKTEALTGGFGFAVVAGVVWGILLITATAGSGFYCATNQMMTASPSYLTSDTLSKARLIVEAWRLYATDRKGNQALENGYATLTPNYLRQVPAPLPQVSIASFQPGVMARTDSRELRAMDAMMLELNGPSGAEICIRIASQAVANGRPTSSASDRIAIVPLGRPFDCVYVDANRNARPDEGEVMRLVYPISPVSQRR